MTEASGRRLKVLLAGLVLAAAVAYVLLAPGLLDALRESVADAGARPKPKVLARTFAEGIVLDRAGYYGIHFVRCDTCRVEKRRLGPLTLGGSNVLVLENLRLVIPPRPDTASATPAAPEKGGNAAKRVLGDLGVDSSMLPGGFPKRVSGLRIDGLSVSRLEGTNVVSVFTARRGEAEAAGLRLSDCVIITEKGERPAAQALLRVKPRLSLEWPQGRMDL